MLKLKSSLLETVSSLLKFNSSLLEKVSSLLKMISSLLEIILSTTPNVKIIHFLSKIDDKAIFSEIADIKERI